MGKHLNQTLKRELKGSVVYCGGCRLSLGREGKMFSTTAIVPDAMAEGGASSNVRPGRRKNSIVIVRDGKEREVDKSNCIILSELPASVSVKLKHLDLTGDGVLDVTDIAALHEKEQAANEGSRNYRILTWVMLGAFFLQILLTFALALGAAQIATPYAFDKSGRMTEKGSSVPVLVASSDTCVLDGMLLPRGADGSCSATNSDGLQTTPYSTKSVVSSTLPDKFFKSLLAVSIVSPLGHYLHANIKAFTRDPNDNSVSLITSYGTVVIGTATYACYDKGDLTEFSKAGFTNGQEFSLFSASQRKLATTSTTTPTAKPTAALQVTTTGTAATAESVAPTSSPTPAPTFALPSGPKILSGQSEIVDVLTMSSQSPNPYTFLPATCPDVITPNLVDFKSLAFNVTGKYFFSGTPSSSPSLSPSPSPFFL
jgi:hypothetical protein